MERELKTLIKDTVRGARFAVRHVAVGTMSTSIPGGQRLSHLADGILRTAEEAVIGLRPGDSVKLSISDALDAMIALGDSQRSPAFADRFRASCYALYKAALEGYGVRNFYLAERSFQKAAGSVKVSEGGHAAFAAAATLALIAESPLRMADVPEGVSGASSTARLSSDLAFVIGLAMTAYAAKQGSVDGRECMASAGEVVAAIGDRLAAAATSPAPQASLSAIYREIGAVLP